jgi:hypothetical protein
MTRWLINNELVRTWKEAIVAQFVVLSQQLRAQNEEIQENPQSSGPILEPKPPEYEVGALLIP